MGTKIYETLKDAVVPSPMDREKTFQDFVLAFTPLKRQDPEQNNFSSVYGDIAAWQDREGTERASIIGGKDSTRLLRRWVQARKLKDQKTMDFLKPMIDTVIQAEMEKNLNAQTPEERFQNSMDNAHPFSRLSALDTRRWIVQATPEERDRALRALDLYRDMFSPSMSERNNVMRIQGMLKKPERVNPNDKGPLFRSVPYTLTPIEVID